MTYRVELTENFWKCLHDRIDRLKNTEALSGLLEVAAFDETYAAEAVTNDVSELISDAIYAEVWNALPNPEEV